MHVFSSIVQVKWLGIFCNDLAGHTSDSFGWQIIHAFLEPFAVF